MSSHGRDAIDCLHFLCCLKILGKSLETEAGKELTCRLCGQNRRLESSAELSCCPRTRQRPVHSARLCFPSTKLMVWCEMKIVVSDLLQEGSHSSGETPCSFICYFIF